MAFSYSRLLIEVQAEGLLAVNFTEVDGLSRAINF